MKATILSVAAFTAFSVMGTAGFFACSDTPIRATANAVKTELLCPDSYAQYLSMQTPSSIAVTEGFLAIADGNVLYLYEESQNRYLSYTADADTIGNVAFDENNVYYLADLFVYKLSISSLQTGTPTPEKLSAFGCSGFLIESGMLYYTTGNKIGCFNLTTNELKTLKTETLPIEPALTFADNTLYYFCENAGASILHAIHPNETGSSADPFVSEFSTQVRSAAIAGNQFCFTDRNGNFYAYNLTQLRASDHLDLITPTYQDCNGYVSLTYANTGIYVIREKTIRLYNTEETSFDNYEISASSNALNRLNGATDICLAEEKLLIADNGNQRISVYDTEQKVFLSPIATELNATYLSAYGDTVLLSSSSVVLYSLADKNYGTPLLTLADEDIQGTIIGSVSLYERYYLLTDENYCYAFSQENGVWQYTETKKEITRRATAFTADVYGSLYVAYDNAAVYRFTESELLSQDGNGEKILDKLPQTEKLAVDYATNLYVLSRGVLQQYTPTENGYVAATAYSPDYKVVNDPNPKLQSFTFGVEKNETYLLYDGDYVVKTDELSLPTVMPVPVGNATDIFQKATTDCVLTEIKKGAIMIEFDLSTLPTAEYFPYLAFERCHNGTTAVRLGSENGYAIVAVQGTNATICKTYLVAESNCTDLPQNDFITTYTQPLVGYLTNNVSLFKYPCLTELLPLTAMERGTQVEIVGEIGKLDHGYYQIRYTAEETEYIGYIPKVFVLLFDGSSPTPETTVIGETNADKDSVWRMAYLLLGLGAIGILVDVLLLRKNKSEEENE